MAEKDRAIDELEAVIQKYLAPSDPQIPLHYLAQAMGRSAVSRMRLMAHHPRQYADKGASMSAAETETLFTLSLTMLEVDSSGHSSNQLRHFLWHVDHHFMYDAFVYVLSQLPTRVAGPLANRAWRQIDVVYLHHSDVFSTKNALHAAIGNMIQRAWNARERYLLSTGVLAHEIPTPTCLSLLRAKRTGHVQMPATVTSQPTTETHARSPWQNQDQAPNQPPTLGPTHTDCHPTLQALTPESLPVPLSYANSASGYEAAVPPERCADDTSGVVASGADAGAGGWLETGPARVLEGADGLLVQEEYSPMDWIYWDELLQGNEMQRFANEDWDIL
jgi:hypothetical protein